VQHYALVSLGAVAAVYVTNLSLHTIPYTIKIVLKSCRVLPVMMLSVPLQSRQYTTGQYASAVAMVAGVLIFFASDWAQIERRRSDWWGITLLMGALGLDALVVNLEEQLFFRCSQPTGRVEVLSYMSAFASLYAFVALAATGALGLAS
jgi:drug/metabolite transporter (DMT)-like permease